MPNETGIGLSFEQVQRGYDRSKRENSISDKWKEARRRVESLTETERNEIAGGFIALYTDFIREDEVAGQLVAKKHLAEGPSEARKAEFAMRWLHHFNEESQRQGKDAIDFTDLWKYLEGVLSPVAYGVVLRFDIRMSSLYPGQLERYRKSALENFEKQAEEGDEEAISALRSFAMIADDEELLRRFENTEPTYEEDVDPKEEDELLRTLGITADKMAKKRTVIPVPRWRYVKPKEGSSHDK